MHTQEQAERYWANVGYADVWVTHGPPYGYFDECPSSVGCHHHLEALKREQPLLNVFGHIHEGGGKVERAPWGTLLANVSVLDGAYKRRDDPIRVIDIRENTGAIVVT